MQGTGRRAVLEDGGDGVGGSEKDDGRVREVGDRLGRAVQRVSTWGGDGVFVVEIRV